MARLVTATGLKATQLRTLNQRPLRPKGVEPFPSMGTHPSVKNIYIISYKYSQYSSNHMKMIDYCFQARYLLTGHPKPYKSSEHRKSGDA
jgi:hypothetical protein